MTSTEGPVLARATRMRHHGAKFKWGHRNCKPSQGYMPGKLDHCKLLTHCAVADIGSGQ
jgi:hypothetical protein